MKKMMNLALVIGLSLFASTIVESKAQAATGKELAAKKKGGKKRKPRGAQPGGSAYDRGQTGPSTGKQSVKAEAAPAEAAPVVEPETPPEVQNGSTIRPYRGNAGKRTRAATAPPPAQSGQTDRTVDSKPSNYKADPHFTLWGGRLGCCSGYETSTLYSHFGASGKVYFLKTVQETQPGWVPYFGFTVQKSPEEGNKFRYKTEMDFSRPYWYGDLSIGIRKDLEFWKSQLELSVGAETLDFAKYQPIFRARIQSNPSEDWRSEFEFVQSDGNRTEGKETILYRNVESLAKGLDIGAFAGSRLYGGVVRHDRIGPVIRYQINDTVAIRVEGEYAFKNGRGATVYLELW